MARRKHRHRPKQSNAVGSAYISGKTMRTLLTSARGIPTKNWLRAEVFMVRARLGIFSNSGCFQVFKICVIYGFLPAVSLLNGDWLCHESSDSGAGLFGVWGARRLHVLSTCTTFIPRGLAGTEHVFLDRWPRRRIVSFWVGPRNVFENEKSRPRFARRRRKGTAEPPEGGAKMANKE